MKRVLITYRIVAVTMAILIGMTSIGMTINMHFCGGSLRSVSLKTSSNSCCSEATNTCGNFEKVADNAYKKCCDDQSIEVQSDDDRAVAQLQGVAPIDNLDALVAVQISADCTLTYGYDVADFEHYRPPLIPKDITVLFETFLL